MINKKLHIRKARQSDILELVSVIERVHNLSDLKFLNFSPSRVENAAKKIIASSNHICLVAVRNGFVVGYLCAQVGFYYASDDGKVFNVLAFGVDSSETNRLGGGRAALQMLLSMINLAKHNGCSAIIMSTTSGGIRARKMMVKLGAAVCGESYIFKS